MKSHTKIFLLNYIGYVTTKDLKYKKTYCANPVYLIFGKVNKTSASKECDICHYWYFLNYSFKFQRNVCNRCHDLLIMSINLSDIAVLNIKGSDYCCIISLVSKNETINLL